ncbi:IclR family transcriptional regulator domain-containing protein [Bosea minatitlanensis]|uniref:IclR family transcriptional regulator C-terminal domain-containing protein n=1 Tax=Bosea minatitlanensis TaxID=128782 RepID=A0ABW0F006_9HYPH
MPHRKISTALAPEWPIGVAKAASTAESDARVTISVRSTDRWAKRPPSQFPTEALEQRIEAIRTNRFAMTHRESFETEISFAAPVFGPTGAVIAAVGTAVVTTQCTVEEACTRLAPALLDLAQPYRAHRKSVGLKEAPRGPVKAPLNECRPPRFSEHHAGVGALRRLRRQRPRGTDNADCPLRRLAARHKAPALSLD